MAAERRGERAVRYAGSFEDHRDGHGATDTRARRTTIDVRRDPVSIAQSGGGGVMLPIR